MYDEPQAMIGARRLGRRRYGLMSAVVALVSLLGAMAPAPVGALLALPLPPKNLGGGATQGMIVYTGRPVPRVLAPCLRALLFLFASLSAAFVLNSVGSGFAGPVSIRGRGTTDCESESLGSGTVRLQLLGYNPVNGSQLDCRTPKPLLPRTNTGSDLHGSYTRVLSDMTLILSGTCTVNLFGAGVVTFAAKLQWVPDRGWQTPAASAVIAGAWAIAPA